MDASNWRMGDGKNDAAWLILASKDTVVCSLEGSRYIADSPQEQKELGEFIIKACSNYEKMKKALEFYAKEESYKKQYDGTYNYNDYTSQIEWDRGNTAREVLKAIKGKSCKK